MGKINFTLRGLQSLPTPTEGKKRTLIRDSNTRGLGLMITPSGHRSFFWFRKIGARPWWKSLGALADVSVENARDEASKLNVAFQAWKARDFEGPSPLEKKREEPTFDVIVEDYIARRLGDRTRAVKNARWMIDKYCGALKLKKLTLIAKKDIRDLHSAIGATHKHTANRVAQLIRTVFNFALREELWTGVNPVHGLSFYPEASRTRFLQPNEFPKFIRTLAAEKNVDLRDFVSLAIFCGARRSNLLAMRWDELDLSRGLWNVPGTKTKNGEALCLPLVREAINILKGRRKSATSNEWVFPGDGKTGHLTDLKRTWNAFRERAGVPDIRAHDLRRTLGSWEAGSGVSLPLIGGSLGHKNSQSTQVYARLNVEPIRAAVRTAVTAMVAAGRKRPPRAMLALPARIPRGGPAVSVSATSP